MSHTADQLPTSPPRSSNSSRASSRRSNKSFNPHRSQSANDPEETTPLLLRQADDDRPNDGHLAIGSPRSPAARSLRSIQESLESSPAGSKGQRRWPSVAALSFLSLLVIAILCLGFAAPAIVEEYAQQAVVFDAKDISIDSFTADGVRARVQGTFTLDASRVQKKSVADIGRMGTWIAREIETRESQVKVYLPEYGNVLLGIATVPPLKFNIRNNHMNTIDFLTDLEAGDVDGIRRIANDWLDGRLGSLRVRGVATVPLKSGILSLGTQRISQSMLFEAHDLPAFPELDIDALRFDERGPPGKPEGMAAMASISVMNDYPVKFDIPPLRFDILVPNCLPDQEYLLLGDAKTDTAFVRPKQFVTLNVTGLIQELPKKLTTACPTSNTSPLDAILADYLQGKDTTIFVSGGTHQESSTPDWMTDLIKGTTVRLPLPGHPFDNLIRNFSLADVHFTLPDPWAEPDSPDSQPKISAVVKALVALPKDMNFNVNVDRVRADADVFYKGEKLGELDLHKWQKATTSKVKDNDKSGLLIQSKVVEAPLNITNDDAFTDLVRSLIFGGKGAELGIKANVDVNTKTALGEFMIRKLPAEGKVFVDPISGGFPDMSPQIGSLEILETTTSSLVVQAKANITNPTEYSAHIPYINILILHNDTILGHVTAKDLNVVPGRNLDLLATAVWNPSEASGVDGGTVGRELLSQYVSGFNTTLTLKTHKDTIPSQPALGRALSGLEIVIDTPKLSPPGSPGHGGKDGDSDPIDNGPHFIRDATVLPAFLAVL